MVVTRYPVEKCANVREHAARVEWQRLCFVLEGIQATHVIESSPDKFAFARAHAAFRSEADRETRAVREAVGRGDFQFFVDRGVAPALLCEAFARLLLRDWAAALASKQARLAEAFEGRFGEDIDVFAATRRNAEILSQPSCDEQSNAVSLLSRWTARRAPAA